MLLWRYLFLLYHSCSHYLQKYSTCSPRAGEVSENMRRKTEQSFPRCRTDEDTLSLSDVLHFSRVSSLSLFFQTQMHLLQKHIFFPEKPLNFFSDMYF